MAITLIELRGVPPVGKHVVQFPGEGLPGDMYPETTWTNVSSTFAGGFFRAEGGLALAFNGGVQGFAQQGHRHNAQPSGASINILTGTGSYSVSVGAQSATFITTTGDAVADGTNGAPAIAAETRPKNYTVRIWKRTA
jgi:hypothetical protein